MRPETCKIKIVLLKADNLRQLLFFSKVKFCFSGDPMEAFASLSLSFLSFSRVVFLAPHAEIRNAKIYIKKILQENFNRITRKHCFPRISLLNVDLIIVLVNRQWRI